MTPSLRYEIEHHITSIREDDQDATFTVRRNGKVFYINISPSNFVNSPIMTSKYLSYLEVLKSGEEVFNDIYDTDVYEWIMQPFEPLFAELAPCPSTAPKEIRITLQDYLFPVFFVFALDTVDEELRPRRIPADRSPQWPSFVRFDDDFLDDLETWTAFYDPVGIVLSYMNPEDALFKTPRKVLIDNGQTECFFKPCYSVVQATEELKAYKKIHRSDLNTKLNICHLHGVVMDDCDFILGLLLTHVACEDLSLSARVHPDDSDDPPYASRRRWMNQLETALSALHDNGITWGDVTAENVLIDRDNNAWMVDCGGGYTQGWVAREMAGTVEGDLSGMAKLRKFLFPSEEVQSDLQTSTIVTGVI